MKLAVYTDYSYHLRGETVHAERAFALFVAELASHVDELTVPGRLDPSPDRAHYPLGSTVNFVPLPYYATLSRPWEATLAMARSLRSLWRVVGGADRVWALGPHPLALAMVVMARLRGRRPALGVRQDYRSYLRTRHPGRPWVWLTGWLLDQAWRLAARRLPVVVVGPALREQYARSRDVLEITVSLVREVQLAAPAKSQPRDHESVLTALSVGRLEAEKNPLMLADVLVALRGLDPRWRMVICGEGALAGALEARADALGVGRHLELRGYIPLGHGLEDEYRLSDALIHVSLTEGLPQVLFEAFAARLPVVATAVGGVGSMGDACLLVEPSDPRAAANALARIGTDAELRSRLAERGLAIVAEHTLERETEQLTRFLRTVGGAPNSDSLGA